MIAPIKAVTASAIFVLPPKTIASLFRAILTREIRGSNNKTIGGSAPTADFYVALMR
jgi:hypothetical protein